jgi:2-desacetyl-2-hydroxyethyl bacteriochlorophyllide A dehydrogenase
MQELGCHGTDVSFYNQANGSMAKLCDNYRATAQVWWLLLDKHYYREVNTMLLPNTTQALFFTAPAQVEWRTIPLASPTADQVLVQTVFSGISPGSELLLFRGQAPGELAADSTIAALRGELQYPCQYGYACVGTVQAIGSAVEPSWLGRWVFAFQPHQSHFCCQPSVLLPLPPGIIPTQALFLPNTETAVNLLHDGRPLLGERVAVLGQGLVGLLTSALLMRMSLGAVWVVDPLPERRALAKALGVTAACAPTALPESELGRFDLIYELSGQPAALNTAINLAGYAGRIVVGSWYGTRSAPLTLGGRFHRERLQLISSQVSTIAPQLSGRWDKARRFALVWQLLESLPNAGWQTVVPAAQAQHAYQQLAQGEGLFWVLMYS